MADINDNLTQLNKSQLAKRDWLSVRANASQFFRQTGVPTRQNEAWKYTSLRAVPWDQLTWTELQVVESLALVKKKVKELAIPDAIRMIFVDGAFVSELSNLKAIQSQVFVEMGAGNLSTRVLQRMKAARRKAQKVEQDSLEALNAMSLQSLITVVISEKTSVKKPIQLLYLSLQERQAFQPRVQIHVGKHSSAQIVETFWQAPTSESLQNSVCEIRLQTEGRLNYVRILNGEDKAYHIGRTRVYLDQQSSFESTSFLLGPSLGRHNLDVYLTGAGASAHVNGASLVFGEQVADHHTIIDHVVGNCTSHQHYKNLLGGQSRAVFDGKVVIRQDAQKAMSEQLNNNLLLTSQAEADSKPQLEIYADDVKATHGSTVGQLSEEELFYFLSRGISREQAEEMLSLGFVAEIAKRNSDAQIGEWLLTQLRDTYRRMRT